MRHVMLCMLMFVLAACQPCALEFEVDYKETAELGDYTMTLEVENERTTAAYDAQDLILIAQSVVEAGYELGLPNMKAVENRLRTGHVIVVSDVVLYNQLYSFPHSYNVDYVDYDAKEETAGFVQIDKVGLDCVIHSGATYLIVVNDEYAHTEKLIIHEMSHVLSVGVFNITDHYHQNLLIWSTLRDLAWEIYLDKQLP